MHIGISGAKGSFSEEAALEYCRTHGLTEPHIEYLVTAENVLSAVERGEVERGIMPIENSNGGVVIEAVHALARHIVTIEKLFEIDVHHNLLVRKGAKREDITAISSHDQALKQCRMYLKRKWPDADIKEYSDTAQAAKDLGEGVLPASTAVIAPKRCAELYGLDILEENINDLKFNFTTFLVVVK